MVNLSSQSVTQPKGLRLGTLEKNAEDFTMTPKEEARMMPIRLGPTPG